jgi:hypothetical protein
VNKGFGVTEATLSLALSLFTAEEGKEFGGNKGFVL